MAAIIFDFDGTIADSFDYIVDFLAKQAKLEPLSAEQKQKLRGLSMVTIARQLGHARWRLLGLFLNGRRRMGATVRHVQPFAEMPELIRKLHAEGHELFIVTSNKARTVRVFLHTQQLHTYFLQIYGGVGLFGKAPALRGLLRDQHIDRKDAVYIGDELRDVQAAQSVGMRVVAVTWGFAQPATLAAKKPTGLANTPAELMAILEEL